MRAADEGQGEVSEIGLVPHEQHALRIGIGREELEHRLGAEAGSERRTDLHRGAIAQLTGGDACGLERPDEGTRGNQIEADPEPAESAGSLPHAGAPVSGQRSFGVRTHPLLTQRGNGMPHDVELHCLPPPGDDR